MEAKSFVRDSETRHAYDLVSKFYDQFTGHHDYEHWISAVLPVLERHGLSGSKLLDLGCGTGKSTLPMLQRGWTVTACDNSAGMLAELSRKLGDRVQIENADALDLPEIGKFDLVLCLGDVLNYCAAEGDPVDVLKGVARNLAPDGLVLFDNNTLQSYRTFFAASETQEMDGHLVTWRGQGDGTAHTGQLAEAVLEVTFPDGSSSRSVHRQKHLSEELVRSLIAAAGLRCLDVYGQGFDAVLEQPVDESVHTKSIFVAKACPQKEERR